MQVPLNTINSLDMSLFVWDLPVGLVQNYCMVGTGKQAKIFQLMGPIVAY